MPEIWDGWRTITDHADRAMVNSLRRGNVPLRGEAQEVGSFRSVPLQEVAAGLLSATGNFAEYEKTVQSRGFRRMPFEAGSVTFHKSAWLFSAELAWEAFRDDLIRFELPAGVTPNPDPAEIVAPGRKEPSPSDSAPSNRKAKAAYQHRIAEFWKRGSPPPLDTTKGGVMGDRQWAVKHGVPRADIMDWRRELLGERAPRRGRPRNSTTK
jgi:hypothetical protein